MFNTLKLYYHGAIFVDFVAIFFIVLFTLDKEIKLSFIFWPSLTSLSTKFFAATLRPFVLPCKNVIRSGITKTHKHKKRLLHNTNI